MAGIRGDRRLVLLADVVHREEGARLPCRVLPSGPPHHHLRRVAGSGPARRLRKVFFLARVSG